MTQSLPRAADAAVLPEPLARRGPGAWREVGSGTLRWSVFEVYVMTYFVSGPTGFPEGDFALEARYLRSLSSETLAKGADEELTRLAPRGATPVPRDWLLSAFPSVERGDRLLAVFEGARRLEMYFNDASLAHLDDPVQVHTFARIWLSPETRAPALRAELLRSNPERT